MNTFTEFYLVWNERTGWTKKKHDTPESAEVEAERIACLQGNEMDNVYVVKAILRKVNQPKPSVTTYYPVEERYKRLLERIKVVKEYGFSDKPFPKLTECPVCGSKSSDVISCVWCCGDCYINDPEVKRLIHSRNL